MTWRLRPLLLLRILVPRVFVTWALVLAACSTNTEPDCTLLPTPGGYAPAACVIQVPNGATVSDGPDGSSVVTLNGSVVATYPPCPCPRPDGGL
jgi:hypothetical protein